LVRGASALLATLALALVLVGPGSAARQETSQKFFADLADNGRIDGHYTRAQINRALHTPSLKQYEARTLQDVPSQATAPASTPAAGEGPRSLPFSGLDLALFGAVGAPLLLLGASLGRLARMKPERELT
jgi:hypothetical protein